MTNLWLAPLLVLALLTPTVVAHETRELADVRNGRGLPALLLPQGVAEGPPLFDTDAASLGVAVPGGRIVAAHDGGDLVFDLHTEEAGWFIVAVDDDDDRTTHLVGVPARVRMYEAMAATAADVPEAKRSAVGALGVFSTDTGPAVHKHGPEASGVTSTWGSQNAWLQWQAQESPGARAGVVERGHAGTILRFSFPETAIGDGLVAGKVHRVLVYHGDSTRGVPVGPFLSESRHEVAEFMLYPGRAGETVGELGRVALALDGARDTAGGLLPLAGAAVVVLLVLVLLPRAQFEAAPRRVEVWSAPPRARNLGRVLLAAAILTLPTILFATPAAAQEISVTGAGLGQVIKARDPCGGKGPVRSYNVSAIDLDIIFNRWGDHDPQGMMYVLEEERSALRAERAALQPVLQGDQTPFPNGTKKSLMTPLVLRANLGECVEIALTNRLDKIPPAAPEDPLGAPAPHVPLPHFRGLPPVPPGALPFPGPEPRRASLHVHGLPLDPLVSGADTTGFNPDTSAGINRTVIYRIGAAREGIFFFHDHADPSSAGSAAFPSLDSAFRGGTVHGLFGALVVEPKGATWTNPDDGTPLKSGWKADVHTGKASFREFVIFYHDPQLVARDDGDIREPRTDHGLNYRVETLSHRLFDDTDRCPEPAAKTENRNVNPCEDISLVYSSNVHGDPGTPIPRAYMGDPTKIRLVHAGMEESHAHHLHGHRWQSMDGDPGSTRIDAQTITPSETFTETLEAGAGGQGVAHAPGDYIYHCHLFPHLYGGMWSFFRVHDRAEVDLKPLPGTQPTPPSSDYRGFPHFVQEHSTPGFRPLRAPQTTGTDPASGMTVAAVGSPYTDVCPSAAPLRRYRLAAIELPIRYNAHGDRDPSARIYVLAEDVAALRADLTPPDPAILRVRQGECMTITLENHLPVSGSEVAIQGFGKVSIHTHLLEYDVLGSDGTSTGWIFDQTIWQNETITYRFYADRDLQTIVWHDHAAGLETAFKGIYGATLVEPPRADFLNPKNGRPIYSMGLSSADGVYDSARDPVTGQYSELWRADIVGSGFKDFREFFASVQDFAALQNAAGRPYRDQTGPVDFADFGLMGLNLRSEPLWHRLGNGTNITNSTRDVFSSTVHGDPSTNLWEAYPGDRTVVRLHQVAYEEIHTFQLNGHRWRQGYRDADSPLISAQTIGVSEAFNAYLDCGAGGCARVPGDYLYRTGGIDDVWAGGWGIFRVHANSTSNLRPLPDADTGPGRSKTADPTVCPGNARHRWFDVVAMEKELIYNGYGDHDQFGRVFVLAHEEQLVREGLLQPKPLTLRVARGDCVHIRLTNHLPTWSLPHGHADPQPTSGFLQTRNGPENTSGNLLRRDPPSPSNHVGLNAHTLTYDVRTSDGGKVGRNPDTTVPPGGDRTYTYYADIPTPGAAFLEDLGDVLQNRHHGLFGALVVLPRGAVGLHPHDGFKLWNDPVADVEIPGARGLGIGWRDIVVFNQNGLSLSDPYGLPVALPGSHTADIDPLTAAKLVQAGLRDFVPGGAARATISDVAPGPYGYHVRGQLEGIPFSADVHRREGMLMDVEFFPGGEPLARSLRVTSDTGAGIAGLPIQTSWQGGTKTTNASGMVRFTDLPKRGSTETVTFPAFGRSFTVWSDAERRVELDLRVPSAADIPLAATMGEDSLAFIRARGMPAGPLGLTAVDVTGSPWRATMRDALREYEVAAEPFTGRVLGSSMPSEAVPSSPVWVVSADEAERIAKDMVRDRFGTSETVLLRTQSRFGDWQIELGTPTNATVVGIDGATGRILRIYRGQAESEPTPLASGGVVLRFRSDDESPLDGTSIEIRRGDTLVHAGALAHGGRFVVPDAVVGGERGTGLRAVIPTHGVDLPLALGPDGKLVAEIHGVSSTNPVSMQDAVDLARGKLAMLAGADSAALRANFGVAGIYHGTNAWEVALASRDSRISFRVDDRTGAVQHGKLTRWETPVDRCSGQITEHGGAHPSPACRWSFSGHDEEDQGLHAYNYRSEPLERRLDRVPDPGFAFSSIVHGENGAPVWTAHVGDIMTMHVIGANDKGRVTGFSVSGHGWPREPHDTKSTPSQGQGGIGPGSVFTMRFFGGAGGGSGLPGDYLVQGAVQRQTAEAGEWGILRVLPREDRAVLKLGEQGRMPFAQRALAAQRESPLDADPCPGAVARAPLILSRGPDGQARATISGSLSLSIGVGIPIRVDIPRSPGMGLRAIDLQATGTGVTVREVVGAPSNTLQDATYCVLVDALSKPKSASLTFEVFGDMSGDADREVIAATVPLNVANAASPPSKTPGRPSNPGGGKAPAGELEEEQKLPMPVPAVLVALALAALAIRRRSHEKNKRR